MNSAGVDKWSQLQERAFSLLSSSSTTAAFDVASEPQSLRERYGQTVNGMSLLLARRLVEARVPFITVFWMENPKIADRCKSAGGWDTHGEQFQLPERLPAAGVRPRFLGVDRRPGRPRTARSKRCCWSPAKWAARPRSATSAPAASAERTRPLDALPERAHGRRRHSRRPGVRRERPPRPSTRPNTASLPPTWPRRSTTPWASTTWRPGTRMAGCSTCWPKGSRWSRCFNLKRRHGLAHSSHKTNRPAGESREPSQENRSRD